mgnify:CR=1 FL=1|tara:strand:- start:360 stop:701 length:342 start_codon:yes stop_codon:yes gene_type:complete
MANFPTTVNPSYGTSKNSEPKIRFTQFGSGYSQRSTFGINQNLKVYNFTWKNISETDSDEIETFLDARAGVEAFNYTPTGESSKKFICRKWKKTIPFLNRASITATFEEVAEA